MAYMRLFAGLTGTAMCDFTHIFAATAALWFHNFHPSFAIDVFYKALLFPAELFQDSVAIPNS
jgi:hypothetical protein